jgi:hypothetical protein
MIDCYLLKNRKIYLIAFQDTQKKKLLVFLHIIPKYENERVPRTYGEF